MNLTKNKPLVITIVAAVILILLMASTSALGAADKAATAVGGIFVPLQAFFYNISDGIRQTFQAKDDLNATDASALQSEIDDYKLRLMNYEDLKAENERLLAMLDYKETNPESELKMARVVGKDPGSWFEVLTIDLGASDGVEKDMAVVTPDGLVGRIEEVGINRSKVMTIADSRSRVPVIVERTRDIGVAGGSLQGNESYSELSVNYLPLDSDITEGDIVLTSGLGGIFPRGLPVGMVISAKAEDSAVDAVIEPMVDFRQVDEVFVIISANQTSEVVNEDITDHNAVTLSTTDVADTSNPNGSAEDNSGIVSGEDGAGQQ